jgi:hypothetical protein
MAENSQNGPKTREGMEFKPCSTASTPAAIPACDYTKWPEVTASPHP